MAIRLRFTTPAGHGQTNIDCGSVHGGRSDRQHTEEAVAELKRCSGTQFDPTLTAKFIELISAQQRAA